MLELLLVAVVVVLAQLVEMVRQVFQEMAVLVLHHL